MARALQLCLLAAIVVCASAGWTDLFGFPWSDVPLPLATTLACPNSSICFVAGSHGNDPFSIYIAPVAQGFKNLTLADNAGQSLMILSMAAAGLNGVTAGVGALHDPGILVTNNGYDWNPSSDIALMTGQDVEAISTQQFAFVGATNALLNEQGVLMSNDGGNTWKAYDWKNNLNLPDGVEARYGAFPSATTWYVAAGSFPSSNMTLPYIKSLTKFRHLDLRNGKYMRGPLRPEYLKPEANEGAGSSFPPMTNGYYAAMTKTTDGGQTWTVQYTNAGAYYFNDVHCADEVTCIAVAEGFADGTSPGARIFVTTDGQTWNQKLIVNDVQTSFVWVRMVSATEAWVGGSFQKSQLNTGAVFYHSTDAGETWSTDGEVKGSAEIMSMWFVDGNLGFATAITELEVTTVLQYTP